MSFVCAACAEGWHKACDGETWCDCQHREQKEEE